jgi:hypothetical protein
MRIRRVLPILVVALTFIAACGDDDASSNTEADTSSNTEATASGGSDTGGSDTGSQGGGGSAGFVTLGGETITLDSARCFLQPQDAAAGGGQILATAQGSGTNAAGDEVAVDFSRFSEDSQFAGDDVKVDVGDPFSDSAVSFGGSVEIGGVDLSGSTVSATGFVLNNFSDFSEVVADFEINC